MRNRSGNKFGIIAVLAAFLAPGVAHAGGFEYAGTGTRSLSRGGAFIASANDPIAAAVNPSNLAGPVRGLQLHLSVGGIINHTCYERDGTYGTDPVSGNRLGGFDSATIYSPVAPDGTQTSNTAAWNGVQNPEVCNGQRVSPVPQLALTWRINERFGLGFGIFAPNAAGLAKYGGEHGGHAGTVPFAMSPTGYAPAPSRYMLTSQSLLVIYPTISFGVQIIPNVLRAGISFGSGIASVDQSIFSKAVAGEGFGSDIHTRITAHDYFIPRATFSLSATPVEGLDISGVFTMQDKINASGHIDVEGAYNALPGSMLGTVPTALRLDGARIQARQPFQAYLGLRYAKRISDEATRPRRFNDDLENNRWDVELVLGYELNSRVKSFDVSTEPVTPTPQLTVVASPTQAPITAGVPPINTHIGHNWKNQFVLRVGGDYALVPGKFFWSGGFSFDTNGVSKGYANIDFQPFRRFGLHTGFVVRVGRTDLSFAAVHFFQQTITQNSNSACANPQPAPVGGPPQSACGETIYGVQQITALTAGAAPTIANSGTIRSGVTMLSLGVTYHFN